MGWMNRRPRQPCAFEARCACDIRVTIERPLPESCEGQAVGTRKTNLHGTIIAPRPLLSRVGSLAFWADSWALPLADASCASISCLDVLEYVRDDVAMIDELARVLRPGGLLRLRVPNAGPFAGLDALNLYRYLVDITRRGRKPPETNEVGWRRHYAVDDLPTLLEPAFSIRSVATRRVGLAELVDFAALVICRWLRQSESRYRRRLPLVHLIERIEDTVRLGQSGSVLEVEAVRSPAPR